MSAARRDLRRQGITVGLRTTVELAWKQSVDFSSLYRIHHLRCCAWSRWYRT